jgi:hypothetical protein
MSKEYETVINSYAGKKRKDYIILGFDYLGNPNLCRVALKEENTYDVVPIDEKNRILINGRWTKNWHH